MDKHEKLDEALEKMREENAANSAAAPPPDWAKLEQNVILRLVRQVKARRVVIIALSTIIVCGIAYFALMKLLFPDMWERNEETNILLPRWHVGEITVSRFETQSLIDKTKHIRYGLIDERPWGSGEYDISILRLGKPLLGSRYIALVMTKGRSYYFIPSTGAQENSLAGSGAARESTYVYKAMLDLTKRMRKDRVWPIQLWPLYPTVRQLSEGKFTVFTGQPLNCFIRLSKLHYGDKSVYTLHSSVMNEGNHFASSTASIWPDRYVIAGVGDHPLMAGDKAGYDVYEDVLRWGGDTKDDLDKLAVSLNFAIKAMPIMEGFSDADFLKQLKAFSDATYPKPPSVIKLADMDELRAMLKPWLWEGWVPGTKQIKEGLDFQKPGTNFGDIDGINFSRPEKGGLQITRGSIGIRFGSGSATVGTSATLVVNGKDALKLDVRHIKPYPLLEKRFDTNTEKLLSDAAELAGEVLAKPNSSWPKSSVPKPYLENWLKEIADRRVVLRIDSPGLIVYSFTKWESNQTEMLFNIMPAIDKQTSFELLVRTDGFSINFPPAESILTSTAGALELVQAEGNKNPVLTATELRQLKGCLGLLVEYLEPKAELSPAGAEDKLKFKLRDGIPENLLPGIEALAAFLEKPELPEAKRVAQPPKLEWGMDTYEAIREALQ